MPTKMQETALNLYGHQIRVRVCGVCIEKGHILLVCHQGIVNNNDVWLPPGGGTDKGEMMAETLKREFLEETGFDVFVGRFLFRTEFIHKPLHSLELYFEVKIAGGTLKKGHDPETGHDTQLISAVKWVPVKSREFLSEDLYRKINN